MAPDSPAELLDRNRELQERLDEAEEILRAIRGGEVDAIVVDSPSGERVYTLKSADEPYRVLVQGMAEGAVSLTPAGLILFANEQFANLIGVPLERVIGGDVHDYVEPPDIAIFEGILAGTSGRKAEIRMHTSSGGSIPVYFSADALTFGDQECVCAIVTDLTDQKRNEEIVAAEKLARSILEQAAEAILVVDPAGRITRASRAADTLAGEPVSQRTFDEIFRITLPNGIAYPFQEIWFGLVQTESINAVEATAELAGGRKVELLLSAARLHGSDSILLGCVIALINITARKRAEAEEREHDLQFRTLADSIPQLAWMTDEKGWIFWYNRRWYEYTGVSPAEVEGWGWRMLQHPDHVDRVVARWKHHVETGEEWEDTFPLLGKDGSYRWFLSRAQPIRNSSGKVVRWFGTNTDITERLLAEEALRQSEARFRCLYEANIVGIVCADMDKFFDANDLFLTMIGRSRSDLDQGRILWREITPREYHHLIERAIQEMAASGSCKPFEIELLRTDGRRAPVLIGATVLPGEPMRWLSFILDLTERKSLEKKLSEKQKLESIGLLAGGIAHDFNNLLVGILGNASLAREIVPAVSPAVRCLDAIVQGSERAAHLTRQMLAYSGRGHFVMENVDVSQVTAEVSNLIQSSISTRIRVHLDLARGLPAVSADSSQIHQVVMNLMINAAEAIGDEPGIIVVRTGIQDVDEAFIRDRLDSPEIEPGRYVCLEVRDTGCGMNRDTMARIFDPFFTTKFTGRGLGLAAVAGIVRGHRGAISVNSSPGKGCAFLVVLPAEAAAPKLSPPAPPKQVEMQGTETVLIVDDEEIVLRTATLALEKRGYTVLQAGNGRAAVEVLQRERDRVSLVLLDWSMPEMNGQETLPELRKIKPGIPVIVSSGYSESQALETFSGLGISAFLQKPYTSAHLAETVRSVLPARGADTPVCRAETPLDPSRHAERRNLR